MLSTSNIEVHNATMVVDDADDPLRGDWFFGEIIKSLKNIPPHPDPEPEPSPEIPFKTPAEFVADMGFKPGDVITQSHIIKRYSAMYKKVPYKAFTEVFQSLGFQETSPRHWTVK